MNDPRDPSLSNVPPPPSAPRPLPPAGWFADPGGRHEHRYWDGAAWTDHVADRGVAGVDPVASPAPVVASTQPAMSSGAPPGVAPPPSVPTTSNDWFSTAEPPRYGPVVGPMRSLQGLCTALTALLWAAVGIGVLGVIAYVNRVSVVDDMLDAFDNGSFRDYLDAQGRAEDADTFVGVVAVLLLAVGITIFVLLVIWMWRVAKNAELYGRPNPRFGPGWTIGGWFIPLASLVIPVLVMQDLWRGSDPESPRGDATWRSQPGSGLVGWWWAFWVTSQLLQIAGNNDGADAVNELDTLRTQDIVSAFAMTAVVAGSILLIFVVRRLTQRQQQLFGAMPPAS